MANATTRILWWALVASLGIYVVVAHLVQPTVAGSVPLDALRAVFVALALGIGTATVVVRRRLLAGPIQRGEVDPSTPAGFARAFPPFVVNLALSESIGILGFVLAFVSGRPVYVIAFAAVAALLLYVHRPTAPDLNPPLRAELGGRPPPIG